MFLQRWSVQPCVRPWNAHRPTPGLGRPHVDLSAMSQSVPGLFPPVFLAMMATIRRPNAAILRR